MKTPLIEPLEARIAPATLILGFTATAASVSEGNLGPAPSHTPDSTPVTFTVHLNGDAHGGTVKVDFSTSDGSAKAGSDYTALSQTITFNPGESEKTITVNVIGDVNFEPGETFLGSLANASITGSSDGTDTVEIDPSKQSETITITNDDAIPTITITGDSKSEGTDQVFTVTLSGSSVDPITVDFATQDNTATLADNDYTQAAGTLFFAPGETTKTITVTTKNDTNVEPDEKFGVLLSNATNATIGTPAADGTIVNNDFAPELKIGNATIVEGDSGTKNLTFEVRLFNGTSTPVTVDFSTVSGTALAGFDFTAVSGTLTLSGTGAESVKTFTVPIIGDTIFENDESFSVKLSNAVGATITSDTGEGKINNDDPLPKLSIANVAVSEGALGETKTAIFNVSLSNPSGTDVTFHYATGDVSATAANNDYVSKTGTVTIPAGQTAATIEITVNGDNVGEANETFSVDLDTLVGASFAGSNKAIGTINNDDGILSIGNITIIEGTGASKIAEFTVTLSGATIFPVTVDFTTLNGDSSTAANNALAGLDYVTTTGSLTFASGETTKKIQVEILGDALAESEETFKVKLSNPVNASTLNDTAIGTIVDDEPTFSVGNLTVVEGTNGTTNAVFIVSLNKAATIPVTVHYATADGTSGNGASPATVADGDYTATSGDLTFRVGELQKTVVVPIGTDSKFENAEDFFLNLSNPSSGAGIASSQGKATITDDDPRASVGAVTVTEGTGGTTNAVFTITLDKATTIAKSFNFTTEDGTAKAGLDYTATAGTVTFAPGETTKTISVPIVTDSIREGSESFALKLTSGETTNNVANATINDDDPAPTVSIADATIVEGAPGQHTISFTLSLSAASEQTVSVNVGTANGTATSADNDFIPVATQTINFAPGETVKTFDVTVLGDLKGETDETFFVDMTSAINGTLATKTRATGTIANDDAALSIDNVTIVEGNSGTKTALFTVTLSSPPLSQTVTVDFATVQNTASSTNDFDAVNGTLTFAPGDPLTKTIAVTIHGDTDAEADENFSVQLSNVQNATLVKSTGTGTIVNDEAQISVSDVTVTEGGNAVFTITRSGTATAPIVVTFETVDGTAIAGSDYTAKSGPVTLATTNSSVTVSVPVTEDILKEGVENFALHLVSATNAIITTASANASITDNDGNPTVSIGNAPSILEGDAGTKNAVFTVTLSTSSNLPITVDYSAIDGTALGASDFTLPGGTLTFAPGETTKTILVPINGDTTDEADEQFSVKLANPTNATIAQSTGTATILNDDVSFTIDDVTISEGDSGTKNAVFTVHLSAASTHTVTVKYTTVDGTAKDGVGDSETGDYTAGNGLLTFAPGETTKTITVPIKGDLLDEHADETFSVKLSDATASIIADDTAVGTITNDDTDHTVSIDDLQIVEGDSGSTNALFKVRLSHSTDQTISVRFSTADGTAIDGLDDIGASDYTFTSGVVTFAPGETEKTISIPIIGDTNAESDETFSVVLSDLSPNATMGKSTAVGTIHDDRVVSVNSIALAEGNTGTTQFVFTVSLDKPAEQTISVDFSTLDGTATVAANDYIAKSGTLTFAAGEQTKTVTVDVNGDATTEADEAFSLKLSNVSNARISSTAGTGVGTIRNDETSFKIVSSTDANSSEVIVTEGTGSGTTNAVFKVIRSGDTTGAGTVQFQTVDGTAVSSGARIDFTKSNLTTLSFAAGETEKTITVPITRDSNHEAQETFTVVLSNPTNGTITSDTGTVKINDDDTLTFTIADPAAVVEGNSGQTNLTFTVTLSGVDETGAVTVDFATADGTAVSTGAAKDFDAASGSLTFASGETSKTITVKVNGDTIDEVNQTFSVGLTNAVGATLARGTATGTITDDDTATITFSGANSGDITVTEGNSGTVDAVFTVKLSAVSESTVTVNFATADGTAISTGLFADFVAQNGTLTFAPGETQKTVTVKVNGDTTGEPTEAFTLKLSGATNATIGDAEATGTITTDDNLPTISIQNVTVVEGDSGQTFAVFTVTLSGEQQAAVTVDFATADSTAKDGVNDGITPADYLATSGKLTFLPKRVDPANPANTLPAETTKTISVPILGDTFKEADETFFVNLSNAANATLQVTQATGTIQNGTDSKIGIFVGDVKVVEGDFERDSTTGQVQTNSDGTVKQKQTAATFHIELSTAAESAITFTAYTANGTAIGGLDYASSSQALTINAGESGKDVTVQVLGDESFEFGATETFTLKLKDLSSNVLVGRGEGTGYIFNDDRFISTDGRTVQYMDVDGDVVTVKTSKGKFSGGQFGWKDSGTVGGEQLQFLDFRGLTAFDGANITISAEPAPGSPTPGNGKVNVGLIIAANVDSNSLQFTSGIDLGTVSIEGDLGRIDAGDNFADNAIAKLEVQSFGAVAGTMPTDSDNKEISNISSVLAGIGQFIVHGDFAGELHVLGGSFGNIGKLQIDGALTGARDEGFVYFTGKVTTATIGKITGGTKVNTGRLLGELATRASIGSVTVLGDIAGGTGQDSGQVQATVISKATIGSIHGNTGLRSGTLIGDGTGGKLGDVTIKGDLVGGTAALTDTSTAASNEAATSGVIFGATGIGKVVIDGSIIGGVPKNSGSISTNGGVTSLTVGKNMTGGAGANSGSFLVGAGAVGDVKIGTSRTGGSLTGGAGATSGLLLAGSFKNVSVTGDIVGGAGSRSGGIESNSSLLNVTIGGSLKGGNSTSSAATVSSGYISAATIKSVLISGDLIGGTDGGGGIAASGAIRATNSIDSVTVKGNVLGNATNSVLISAAGSIAGSTSHGTLVLKSLNLATTAGHAVRFANILAGYGGTVSKDAKLGIAFNGDAQIGDVFIGGPVSGLNIVAGAKTGSTNADDGRFGTADDAVINSSGGVDDLKLISRIASVVITGAVEKDADPAKAYGIVAQQIDSLKIGSAAAIVLKADAARHSAVLGDAEAKFTAVQLPLPS